MPEFFLKLRKSTELLLLFGIVITAIFFRTLHFEKSFNFSSDQGAFSLTALEKWQNKELALVGPPFSFHIGDKVIYQGPFIYYLQTFFLVLGNWDPKNASLVFTIFSCLMLIPLYFGTKNLISQKAAFLLCAIYALNPFYILYTKFLWNPNFQFALLPGLIWLMGNYHKKPQPKWLLLIGLIIGLLLQLHYQFFLGLIGIFVFYILWKRISWGSFSLIAVGGIIAYLPFIYYELTHKFYNLDNLFFFLTHRDILYLQNKDQSSFAQHYYLSLSFLFLLVVVAILRNKITTELTVFLSGTLLIISGYYFIPSPSSAYGMADGWNYQNEVKVYQIIKDQQFESFNIVNLEYDTLSHVQKYLLKKDRITIDSDNYYSNQYLFAVSKKADLFSYLPYEIQSFRPSKIVNSWRINPYYHLYLLERVSQ